MKDQSEQRIEQDGTERKPRVRRAECDAARPACCPKCKAPSRPLGGSLQMHGHGRRGRTQRGPVAVGQRPGEQSVEVLRFKCTQCNATITVAPRGVVRRRLYRAGSIALALALFGLQRDGTQAVRAAVAPTASARVPGEGAMWSTLRRWAHEAKTGTLFIEGHACPASFTLRQAAERAAMTLAALGPRGAEPLDRVWQGAFEARWGKAIVT